MRLYVGVHLKITKRFFIILICFVFALCLIIQTGCNSDDSITPITIRFWHTYTGKQRDIFAMLVDTYNTTEGKSRNVFVVAEYKTQEEITNYLETAFSSQASSVEYPEITFISKESAYKANMHNLVVNAEKYLSKQELKGYFDGFMKEGQIAGTDETFVFPISKTSSVTIINDSMWRQFYVDENVKLKQWETWSGINSLAEKYYQWSNGRALIAFESVEDFIFTYSAQQLPPLVQTGNKEIRINTNKETLRGIWDFYYSGVINGYILQTDNVLESLEQGKIVAYLGEPHDMTFFPKKYINFNGENSTFLITSALYPTINDSRKVYPQKGNGVSVFNHGEEINQASYDFLHWLCSNENVIQFSVANNEISSFQPIYEKKSTEQFFKQLSVFNYKKHQILSNSLHQVTEGKTYSPTGFVEYDSFCEEITHSLIDISSKALSEVHGYEKEGFTHQQAVKMVDTEDRFKIWYENVLAIANKY